MSRLQQKEYNNMAAHTCKVTINVELDLVGHSVPVEIEATFCDAEWLDGRVEYEAYFEIHSAWWGSHEVSDEIDEYYTEAIWEAYHRKLEADRDDYDVAYEDYQLSRYATEEKAYC